jgi:16S rRNA processing protein RimM
VLSDRPEARFATGAVLHLEGDARPLTIAAAEPVEDGPGWRLRFREIPDRAAAERLRERYLEIAVDRAADLEAGVAYWHEVIGSSVRDSRGTELGKVADVYRAGETEVYVVRGGPAGEFDVPAVRSIITTFAPERGELVVDEAVLDLDARPMDAPSPRAARPERRRPRWSRHGKGGQPSQSSAAAEAAPEAAAAPPEASSAPPEPAPPPRDPAPPRTDAAPGAPE